MMPAEKSVYGHEEGKHEGPDHDDIGFVGPVHFPFYLGILHLVIEMEPVPAFCTWEWISLFMEMQQH